MHSPKRITFFQEPVSTPFAASTLAPASSLNLGSLIDLASPISLAASDSLGASDVHRAPASFTQEDLIVPGQLCGWPNGSFDTNFLDPARELFLKSVLSVEHKTEILQMVQKLKPWSRYHVFLSIICQPSSEEKASRCEELLKVINSLDPTKEQVVMKL